MKEYDWRNPHTRCLGLLLFGNELQEYSEKLKRLKDNSFLFLVNAHWEPIEFLLPDCPQKGCWRLIFDTSRDRRDLTRVLVSGGRRYSLMARSSVLLIEDPPRVSSVRDLKHRTSTEWSIPSLPQSPEEVPPILYGLYPYS